MLCSVLTAIRTHLDVKHSRVANFANCFLETAENSKRKSIMNEFCSLGGDAAKGIPNKNPNDKVLLIFNFEVPPTNEEARRLIRDAVAKFSKIRILH